MATRDKYSDERSTVRLPAQAESFKKKTTTSTAVPAGTTIQFVNSGKSLIADGNGKWYNPSSGQTATASSTPQNTSSQLNYFQQNSLDKLLGNFNMNGTVSDPSWESVQAFMDARKNPPADVSGGGSGSGSIGNGNGASSATVSDPYADIYAIYQQRLNAQNAANEQRRQAQLNALQSNYANAKSRLTDAFSSGEASLNNDADRALREAYIQSRLNEKNLNQQLQSMGINGGAMESSLARAYNEYGNNRNAIEQNRMDALKELLSQFNGQLGNMESAYTANLADLDSNYFGNGLDYITDYYDTIANLQAKNAASNLRNALGKSGGSTVNTDGGLNKDVLSVGKTYKGNGAGFKKYMDAIGIPEDQQSLYQLSVGNDPDGLDMVAQNVRNAVLGELKNVPASMASNPPVQAMYIDNLMQQLATKYGLTQSQAKALLAEAGY